MTRRLRTITQLTYGASLLATGLLAGAFGYGAANLVPTFDAVPQSMRFDFHTELMKINGITVQGAMALATLGSLALATLTRGRPHTLSATASALTLASFLITRFGNVPINAKIKHWATHGPGPDTAELLHRWELFNITRTLTALAAFVLLIALTRRTESTPEAHRPHARPAPRTPAAQ